MKKVIGTREERRKRRAAQRDAILAMLGTEREVAWRVDAAIVVWDGGPGGAHLFYRPKRDPGPARLGGSAGFWDDGWVLLGQIPGVLSQWDLDLLALEMGIRKLPGLLQGPYTVP